MTENKRAIATDLKKLDAHMVQPSEYEDAPELTGEQLAAADVYEGGKLVRRGRPPSPHRKIPVKVRLDPELVAKLRASGAGWQTRINDALRALVLNKRVPEGAVVRLKLAGAARATGAKAMKTTKRIARVKAGGAKGAKTIKTAPRRHTPKAKRA
jgi:uncharacterized protein (DUF4415 family)